MAHDTKLGVSEVKQLGSLPCDMGTENGIGKKTNSQPLEVTVMQEGRYCLKDNLVVHPSTTTECHGKIVSNI